MKKWMNGVLCLFLVFCCSATVSAATLDTANLTVSGNTVTIGAEEDTVLEALHQAGKTAKIAIPCQKMENAFVMKDGNEIVTTDPEWLEKGEETYARFPVAGAGIYTVVNSRLDLTGSELANQDIVWLDGMACRVETDDMGKSFVKLPDPGVSFLTAYSFENKDSSDPHTQYPTGMKVWTVELEENGYKITYIPELDNLLQYSGCSIRVAGKQGVRMITSIEKSKKSELVCDGLAGYTLKEYGTVIAWASQLTNGNPLVLGKSYAKSNYAYKKGVADPVFAYDGGLMQYTNVLVGFGLDQCKNDIAMRPYMILTDTEGNEVTLYGGIVQRSIGYIAAQNAYTFDPVTQASANKYVWDIITHVYGEDYIPEVA